MFIIVHFFVRYQTNHSDVLFWQRHLYLKKCCIGFFYIYKILKIKAGTVKQNKICLLLEFE